MQEGLILSIRKDIVGQLEFIYFELKYDLLSDRGLIRIPERSPYENEMRISLNG